MASTYLTRTNGTSTEQKIFTFSAWVKKSAISTSGDKVLMAEYTDSNNRMKLQFKSDDFFEVVQLDGGNVRTQVTTNRKFRDCSAWYHIVVACDNTQGTNTNRVKIYVNGEQETSFSIATYPFSSTIPNLNENSKTITIGNDDNGGNYFDGSMSHVHFIDGTAYDASAFGETDSTTGEWKINTSPSVTYGNNGFFILKDGNTITDSSTNSNNFSLGGGTLTKTEDCPSNVFATFNSLAKSATGTATYSNGNTTVATNDANLFGGMSTLGMTSGKYYAEAKRVSQDSGNADDGFRISFGVTNVINHSTNAPPSTSGNYIMIGNGTVYNGGTDLGVLGGSANISDNGVQQIALDLDNNRITWGFNGQWMDGSGNYNQSSPSHYVTITDPDSTDAGYFFLTSDGSNGRGYTASWNFGNGYFGTTAVSSAGTNASGIGIFEYDVPTGFTALSTKGLNL